MLAELRGFGAGLVVVDQTPSALVPAVLANTGTKVLHRLDHPADRELSGRAAGLPSDHVDLLGALRPGEAILRSDRRPKPFRLRMPNPSITYGQLPLPDLPQPAPGEQSRTESRCPVCGDASCRAYWIGCRKEDLKRRIAALKELEAAPSPEIQEWVKSELASGGADTRSHHLRCFLIGLGQTAMLKEGTISRFLSALES